MLTVLILALRRLTSVPEVGPFLPRRYIKTTKGLSAVQDICVEDAFFLEQGPYIVEESHKISSLLTSKKPIASN